MLAFRQVSNENPSYQLKSHISCMPSPYRDEKYHIMCCVLMMNEKRARTKLIVADRRKTVTTLSIYYFLTIEVCINKSLAHLMTRQYGK